MHSNNHLYCIFSLRNLAGKCNFIQTPRSNESKVLLVRSGLPKCPLSPFCDIRITEILRFHRRRFLSYKMTSAAPAHGTACRALVVQYTKWTLSIIWMNDVTYFCRKSGRTDLYTVQKSIIREGGRLWRLYTDMHD